MRYLLLLLLGACSHTSDLFPPADPNFKSTYQSFEYPIEAVKPDADMRAAINAFHAGIVNKEHL